MSGFGEGFLSCVGLDVLALVVYLLRHRILKALGREASAEGTKLEAK